MTLSQSVSMPHRRCGRSGLMLPAISLGLWQGTGSYVDEQKSRSIVLGAFERGITHIDLANNYGTPAGASESLFGRIVKELPRHELVISTKAGYRMWPGHHGEGGSRKHLIQSCEQSLQRLGLDHVDIFYSHRFDPDTPLEETLGALDHLVRSGKAIYAGISNYADPHFTRAVDLGRCRSPVTIHQPRYSMLDRRAEQAVLPTAAREGVGVVAFSPLEQGILAGRYLHGIPADARAAISQGNGALTADRLNPVTLEKARKLAVIAQVRGQTPAQLALSWILRDSRITSVLIGASRPEQLDDCLGAVAAPPFSAEELAQIDAICL